MKSGKGGKMLEKLQKLINGKKTYICMILVAIGAVLQYKGIVIPDYVWTLLAALGLGAVRSAISKTTPPA